MKPLSDSDPKLLLRFSRYLTESRTCYQCGEKVYLSASCPQKVRRVSLTEGTIRYEGPSETRPRVRHRGTWEVSYQLPAKVSSLMMFALKIQHLRWVDSTLRLLTMRP